MTAEMQWNWFITLPGGKRNPSVNAFNFLSSINIRRPDTRAQAAGNAAIYLDNDPTAFSYRSNNRVKKKYCITAPSLPGTRLQESVHYKCSVECIEIVI